MANTFREVYKKTGDSSYQLVGNIGVNGIKLDVMKGASSSIAGEIGLVPKPNIGQQDYLLTGDGSWKNISKYLGTVSISEIGDGTVKGAIFNLNDILQNIEYEKVTIKPYPEFSDSNSMTIRIYKILKLVIFEMEWIGQVGNEFSTIAEYKIPNGYRPNTNKYFTMANCSSGKIEGYGSTRIRLGANGDIYFSTDNQNFLERHGSISYLLE